MPLALPRLTVSYTRTWMEGMPLLTAWGLPPPLSIETKVCGNIDGRSSLLITSLPPLAMTGAARRCSAVIYLEGEGGNDMRVVKWLEALPEHISLLYLGNWRGANTTDAPPLEAEVVSQQSVTGPVKMRRVVRLYWPYGLAGFPLEQHYDVCKALGRSSGQAPGSAAEQRPGFLAGAMSRCHAYRDSLFIRLCNAAAAHGLGPCDALSRCPTTLVPAKRNANSTLANRTDSHWARSVVDTFRRYRFAAAIENSDPRSGYVTEKIVNAFAAGAVPIYAGDPWVLRIFNPAAFVYVERYGDTNAAMRAIDYIIRLAKDPARLEAMRSEPPLTDVGRQLLFGGPASTAAIGRLQRALQLLLLDPK